MRARHLILACLLVARAGAPACPEHTAAPPGSRSILDCACDPGYDCSYSTQLQAIATLNATLRAFLDDTGGVQTAFVRAVSAAAAVAADQVVIQGAVDRAALPGAGARRMLALSAPLDAMPIGERFRALEATGEAPYDDPAWLEPDAPVPPGPIHVFAAVHGSAGLRALDAELARRAPGLHLAHHWEPDHRVLPRRRAAAPDERGAFEIRPGTDERGAFEIRPGTAAI